MSLIRPNTCKNCAYKANNGGEQLVCRLNPPTPHPIIAMTPKGPQHIATLALFPPVDGDAWCGQHKRRLALAEDVAELPRAASN